MCDGHGARRPDRLGGQLLTAAALLVVAIVLFIPSETPARRLGQLIEAWRSPPGPALPPSPDADGP